ncbi:bifunctional indole-3-glycerol-phosphate synthase TrpC/phosphoribosylanthranilate isomerase TrpF, partial [Candidatus Woesearchaeota archaeon]|nr:bifunctional indole-3-glycerol-phosphate synthase TrpC/phosphoribosylanthranilate isomerase TrpF [Candidatus Woesearchaeota archaeon]
EYKRASPSFGNFAKQKELKNVLEIYNRYASAISILTDKKFFNGSLDDIKEAGRFTSLPILRKDFIIDEYQIYEARSYGADVILLIVKILKDDEIKRFLETAKSLGMQCIVEINDKEEFDRIKDFDVEVIGINNRNLDTLIVDKDNANRLSKMIKSELENKDVAIIAESGLSSKEDIRALPNAIDAVLIGSSFMKLELDKMGDKFIELLNLNENNNKPKIKICGITNREDALLAAELGADFIGLIFYDKSKRFVDEVKAKEICDELSKKFADVKKVGVFVNEKIEKIVEKVNLLGLDIVQLHGNESDEFVIELKKKLEKTKIIKAIRVRDNTDLIAEIKNKINSADYILLDTYSEDAYGGTGKSFDWNKLVDLKKGLEDIEISFSQKVFLSGGINSSNIEKILVYNPFAIDISSGVETSPGKKDKNKLIELFAKVK